MNETYVAILFKREVNGVVHEFTPITVIEGDYDETENQFMDSEGKIYDSIKAANLVDEQELFEFPISLEQLKENYDTEDIEQAIKQYCNDVCATYKGIVDDKTNVLTLYLVGPKGKLIEIENIEPEEDSLCISEDGIRAMLQMESLEEVQDFLNQVLALKGGNIELYETQVELPQEPEIEFLKPGINLDVKDMYETITAKVINQDEAVRKIIMNIISHNIMVNSKEFLEKYPNPKLTRCLITGPTGSGKSLIIESIIDYLSRNTSVNIPAVKAPDLKIAPDGSVGIELSDILGELISKVTITSEIGARIKYAEKNGIVFFDGIDKRVNEINGDDLVRSVLNSVRQFAQGQTYEICGLENGDIDENSPSYYFNTKYLNILAAGNFANIKRLNKDARIRTFGEEQNGKEQPVFADYVASGLVPTELAEDFHQVISLDSLSKDDLKKILISSTVSPILIEKAKSELEGLHLTWEDSFLEAVARKAHKTKTGAHSLKSIIEDAIAEAKWDFMCNGRFSEVGLTGKTVENPKVYTKK